MATIELTKENLQSTIDDNDIVLIDFWADWCGPCKAFGPVFEKSSEQHPDVVFAKCDTQNQPEVAAAFDVQSIPTLAVFRDKVLLFLQPGALPPTALEELIAKVKELDMTEVRASIAAQQPPAGEPAAPPSREPPTAAPEQRGQAAGAQAEPPKKVVQTVETGAGLADLADDFVLRRQGVTREFLQQARSSQGVARQVLEMYERVRAETREGGAEGRARAEEARRSWDFDPARDLADLDADTRSELKAVVRAIDELLKS